MNIKRLASIHLRWLTAVLTAGVVVAACGSSSSASAKVSSSNGKSASKPLTSVTIGLPVFNLTDAPILIAEQKGYFAAHGVKVSTTQLNGSTEAEAALQGGSVDFVTVASPAIAVGISKKLPLISVASLLDGAAEQLIVSTSYLKTHGNGISTSAPLKNKLEALAGSEFGVAGLTDKAFLDYLLSSQGLSLTSIKTTSLSSSTSQLAALSHGEIDEFISSPPLSYEAEAQGTGTIFINTPAAWKNLQFFLLVTTHSYANDNSKVVTGVASAIAEADKYITSNPKGAATLLHSNSSFNKLSLKIIQESLAAIPFSTNGLQSAQSWSKAINLEVSTGQLKTAVNLVQNKDWTNKYVQGS